MPNFCPKARDIQAPTDVTLQNPSEGADLFSRGFAEMLHSVYLRVSEMCQQQRLAHRAHQRSCCVGRPVLVLS
jgi:hypothetical protein